MAERSINHLLLVCVILGLFVVDAQSSIINFPECYAVCFAKCILFRSSAAKCAAKCMKCVVRPTLTSEMEQNQYFCKLGCAYSNCINISTKNNPAVEKVTKCVSSCSSACSKDSKLGEVGV